MNHLSHQLTDQFLCMDMKTQQLPMSASNSLLTTAVSHYPMSDLNKTPISRSHSTSLTNINRFLSTSSFDQFPSLQHQHHRFEEEQPLRIHVGNIPFLWTIDDLCKQFLVFGPIKDPEIVMNERGSKGFGFITFLRHSDGINAIRVKNGSIADGRKITVALASSRSSTRLNTCHCHCCYINTNPVN